MDLFKKMWYKNQAKLKGYVLKTQNQQDTQASFISQAPVKRT